MPKAEPLTAAVLDVPQPVPQAATVARGAAAKAKQAPEPAPKAAHVPLQVRLPREQVRAIKRAAIDRDQTISEFMLACFQAYMKTQ